MKIKSVKELSLWECYWQIIISAGLLIWKNILPIGDKNETSFWNN